MTVDYHGAWDEAALLALNRGAGELADRAAELLSARPFGIAVGVLLALAMAVALARGRRRLALLLALALAVAASDLLGARLLRPLLGRMRPQYALPPGTVRRLLHAANVGSLPSLHAANFFAMATVAWAASWRLGIAAVTLAVAVAWSRVYGGVHWPSDVVAGAAWGIACGLAALAVARRIVGVDPDRGRPPLEL